MHATAVVNRDTPYAGIQLGKFAMWLFLASEVMFFTGLIGAYIILRAGSPEWPNPASRLDINLTALNTFILICSSVSMVRALYAVQKGDQSGFRQNLLYTIVMGSVFLSVQAYEWNHLFHEVMKPGDDLFAATFYTLTGFHGAHVTAGVVTLVILFFRGLGGRYNALNNEAIENAGLYWHFVDLVWILLFTIVYLI
jgi:heme/copper-type cytochrome/quinol oxidase subunit 3